MTEYAVGCSWSELHYGWATINADSKEEARQKIMDIPDDQLFIEMRKRKTYVNVVDDSFVLNEVREEVGVAAKSTESDRESIACDRDEMTKDQEREFVSQWYKNYEQGGFTKTFFSPYSEYENRIGQRFSVVRRLSEEEADLECLPMWEIMFEDGEKICVYPEEITNIEFKEEWSHAS
jgi:hypothetical protein